MTTSLSMETLKDRFSNSSLKEKQLHLHEDVQELDAKIKPEVHNTNMYEPY